MTTSPLLTSPRLFTAVVGSHAYGLATPKSDIDLFGVSVLPTSRLVGLNPPRAESLTYHSTGAEQDITVHEVGKFLHLAVKGNPSVLETFWLTDYVEVSPSGRALLSLRRAVLSARAVRSSYLGYCAAQAHGAKHKAEARRPKFGTHLYRLAEQARGLWLTGELNVTVLDPDAAREFGRQVADGDLDVVEELMSGLNAVFDRPTPLPETADTTTVNQWVIDLRKANF